MMTFVYFVLIFFSTRQTRRSRTPSGLSRVSRWVFLPQAALDCVAFAGHLTFAVLAEGRTSLALLAPAFLACVMFLIEVVCLIVEVSLPYSQPPFPAILFIGTPNPNTRRCYTSGNRTATSTCAASASSGPDNARFHSRHTRPSTSSTNAHTATATKFLLVLYSSYPDRPAS